MTIRRLNMDNSWHIKFAGLSFLIDPWLKGVEVDFFSWFNTQWHRTKPVTIDQIPPYDIIIITQKYPDHFHPETLTSLDIKKIVVPASIEQKVKQLLPDATVWTLNQSVSKVLNDTVRLHYLPSQRKIDPIYDAVVLEDGAESLLLATHGYTDSEEWTKYIDKLPPVKLAFTPFNNYKLPFFLGGTVSPGMQAVRELIDRLKPEHIIATHDEDKHATGIVNRMAKITFAPSTEELLKDSDFANRLITINNYHSLTI